jgi:AcrR family transcriptional regulator
MNPEPAPDLLPAAPSRQRILTSALELFANQGFGSTSVKAIARQAGVSQGLMYTYFTSKDDLLRAIFHEGLEDVWSTLPAGTPADPLAAIEGVLRASFALVGQHEHLWRLLYALRVQPEVTARIGVELDAWGSATLAELRRLCELAGLERPEVEARLLFAVIDGANQHRTLSSEPYPVEELITVLMGKYRQGRST